MIYATAAGSHGPEFAASKCRDQLERILGSADFEATARERRFLAYVVEETLADRASRIKAYSIAIEVFGRESSFDPQTDPIVRIEAGHLRRSLERYYLKAGRSDPILITIPKGAYVPEFSHRVPQSLPEADDPVRSTPAVVTNHGASRPQWIGVLLVAVVAVSGVLFLRPGNVGTQSAPDVPRVLVEKFNDLGKTDASFAVAAGLTEEVIGQLSKFRDIVVVQAADGSMPDARYALAGSVSMAPAAFRLQVKLVNRKDGAVLWADSYASAMNVAEILKAQADIAQKVVSSLAQTYGVIYQADATMMVAAAPDDWTAYSCTLSYYEYRVSLDAKARAEVRACLEKAVERFPDYATAWALLAQVGIDDLRFQFPYDPVTSPGALDRVLGMARRATNLDPLNTRGLHAEMAALFLSGNFAAGRKVGEQALVINPNDPDMLGGFGTRLALSGSWEEGCAMIRQARERNVGPFGYYEVILALCSYIGSDYEQAIVWIRKTPISENPLYHLIAAAILGEAGMTAEADRERVWLEQHMPALVENARQEVTHRLGRPQDAERFIASLRKAGFDFDH